MIKVGVKGKVLQSKKHKGWYIMVDPTGSKSDPYYIYYSTDFDFESSGEGYDDWVQDYEAVEEYFKFTNLEVEWLESSENDAK